MNTIKFFVTPVIAIVIISIIEFTADLELAWFRPSLALAILAFGFNVRWANGLYSNLLTAGIIVGYGLWSVHFEPGLVWQWAIVVFGIAISNGWIKSRLREEQDAVTRQQVQIERARDQAVILDDLVQSSDAIRRNVKYIEMAREDIENYLLRNKTESLQKALSKLADVETMIVGWQALDRAIESVEKRYKNG